MEELDKMYMSLNNSKIRIGLKGIGKAVIDWGRSSNEVELKEDIIFWFKYAYEYSGIPAHEVIIYSENITFLNFRYNKIQELDISNNVNLKRLYCDSNPMTASNIIGLKSLDILQIDNVYIDI